MDESPSATNPRKGGSGRAMQIALLAGVLIGLGLLGRAAMKSHGETAPGPAASAFVPPRPSGARPPAEKVPLADGHIEDVPPSRDMLDLLGTAQVGADVGGFRIESIVVPVDGDMLYSAAIRVARAGDSFLVWIASKGTQPFRPRSETEHYALFYGGKVPPNQRTTDQEIDAVLQALMTQIKANEERVPLPPEL